MTIFRYASIYGAPPLSLANAVEWSRPYSGKGATRKEGLGRVEDRGFKMWTLGILFLSFFLITKINLQLAYM